VRLISMIELLYAAYLASRRGNGKSTLLTAP
jgi:hypothetical protein